MPEIQKKNETNKARIPFAEQAYNELKRKILENILPAGSQFLEQEIAEQLSMSRTPTREAMVRLANEGLVEVRPRHGMRVLPISPNALIAARRTATFILSRCAIKISRLTLPLSFSLSILGGPKSDIEWTHS